MVAMDDGGGQGLVKVTRAGGGGQGWSWWPWAGGGGRGLVEVADCDLPPRYLLHSQGGG